MIEPSWCRSAFFLLFFFLVLHSTWKAITKILQSVWITIQRLTVDVILMPAGRSIINVGNSTKQWIVFSMITMRVLNLFYVNLHTLTHILDDIHVYIEREAAKDLEWNVRKYECPFNTNNQKRGIVHFPFDFAFCPQFKFTNSFNFIKLSSSFYNISFAPC